MRVPQLRRSRPRARSVAARQLTRSALQLGWLDLDLTREQADALHAERPKTREECRDAQRPCPWVSCRHHLYLDVDPDTGTIKLNFPDLEPGDMQHSCSLDVAESGASTFERVGEVLNITRERARQVEVDGLFNTRGAAWANGIDASDIGSFAHAPGDVMPEPASGVDSIPLRRLLDERLKAQGQFSPTGWRRQAK